MKIEQYLLQATTQLDEAGIATARLDCLVLISDALGKDKAWILSHADEELKGSVLKKLDTKIAQRFKHIPLAYIRGKAEFYGREFAVNAHTLVPRPETEAMIELLKVVRNMEADMNVWQVERRGRKSIKKRYAFEKTEPNSNLVKTEDGFRVVWQKPKRSQLTQSPAPIHGQSLRYHDEDLCIIDIGTGSGAIAITAKLEIPEATVIATDIDENCLKTAKTNAQKLGTDITLLRGNLFEPIATILRPKTSILLCNLPYVPDNFQINTAATHEPSHALFGGPDGLDLYRELFHQITRVPLDSSRGTLVRPEYVITESLPPQHKILAKIASGSGYKLIKTEDFVQLFERLSD